MDVCGVHMSGKSSSVLFLPTHAPEDSQRLLRPARELRARGPNSTDIYLDDQWIKYLKRPLGTRFDSLSYIDFCVNYRQETTNRSARPPPYNITESDQDDDQDDGDAQEDDVDMDQNQEAEGVDGQAGEGDAGNNNGQQPRIAHAGTKGKKKAAPLYLDCNDPLRKWVYRSKKKGLVRYRSTPCPSRNIFFSLSIL